MGRRGPKAAPDKILEMRGSRQLERRDPNRLQTKPELPNVPKWLGKEARAAWSYIVPRLHDLGVISKIDRDVLTVFCDQVGVYRRCAEWVKEHGECKTVEDEITGEITTTTHAQTRLRDKAAAQILKLSREFGLTPSARTGINLDFVMAGASEGEREKANDGRPNLFGSA